MVNLLQNNLGPGGTGKSHLIKILSKWIEKTLRVAGDDPDNPKVLIMTFTGKAAINIGNNLLLFLSKILYIKIIILLKGGTTIHSALNMNFGNEYIPLGDETKQKLQHHFKDLRVVIIDEFSMVSADLFYNINRRLQDIMGLKDPFGGLAVIMLGDLLQLSPVKGRKTFHSPLNFNARVFWSVKPNLWDKFEVSFLSTAIFLKIHLISLRKKML